MPGLRLVAALTLVLAATGCKKAHTNAGPAEAGKPQRVGRRDVAPAGPRLPEPHRLAQEPDAGAFVARPAELLAGLDSQLPQVPPLSDVAELVLGTQAPAELASSLARQIAGDRPWAAVHVAGEDIVLLPVRPGGDVAAALQKFPARGDFGAVELPPPAIDIHRDRNPPAPRLAWLDGQTNNVVFAATLQGLSTSRQLPATYGARPVWGTLSATRARLSLPVFPYARLGVVGQGLHALDITALAPEGQPLPETKQIAPGALTGMLADAAIAAGVSTRWPGYKKAVQDIIRDMNNSVDRAGFAAKLMLAPLVDQAARVLRRWNGRVLLAVGPARHVRVGLGADETDNAYKDLVGLLRTLIDNLQLARMFADVPGASLKKVDGVYLLTVEGLSRQLPAAARPVLDDKGRIRVAFGASDKTGGVAVVVGPDPAPVLKAWLEELAAAEPAKKTQDDLIAGALAIGRERLEPLLKEPVQQSALLDAILRLEADRPPTRLVVEQKPDRYQATVRGPERPAPRAGGRRPD